MPEKGRNDRPQDIADALIEMEDAKAAKATAASRGAALRRCAALVAVGMIADRSRHLECDASG
jgi:uncharacterized ferredoxin-like protein